ncbi:hypothetical protein PENTCL1PPCAC_27485 [Pristionchus entomophagus]|uniref:glutathione transferase n=1 Tax=Pristionchus entomophagus TaxID=358040 RepID=A0AAV5UEB4_9BILA|nr:hypothetical protein PENTCL1PPCAC_27485 [Pristionchus entomophagus]
MPAYKLYYFPLRGRGEPIRQLLKLAHQPFEDYRINPEEWAGVKADMPLGQVPVLEVDGSTKLAQTMTILRYIANQHGLAGRNPEENAKLDMIAECVQEMINAPKIFNWALIVLDKCCDITTEDQKNDFFKHKVTPEIEAYAPKIERFLLANGNNGLFMGDTETWVDVFAAEVFTKFVEFGDPACLDAFPHIKADIAHFSLYHDTMPTIKLIYFDGRGRGESIRHLLKLAKVPFEDCRITFEEWIALKRTTPLGNIPILEIDGVHICPTSTIHRFIGNQYGRGGSNALEKARLDMIGEVIQDLSSDYGPNWFGRCLLGRDPEYPTKVHQRLYFKQKVVPAIEKFAPFIEKFLIENGNNGFFLGDSETWADVFAAEQFAKFIDYGEPECLDAYPSIKKLIARVQSNPLIAEHIRTRRPAIA